jgi:hypothetical protein
MTPRIFTTACAVCVLLLACKPVDTTTRKVPYGAFNHTDANILSITIAGAWGVLNASQHTLRNAETCCIALPRQWTPGLTATIQWQEEGRWRVDNNGKSVLDSTDDKKFFVGPKKTRTVSIPRYDHDGDFYIFFFPGDDVRVAITDSPEWQEWVKYSPEDKKHKDKLEREAIERTAPVSSP